MEKQPKIERSKLKWDRYEIDVENDTINFFYKDEEIDTHCLTDAIDRYLEDQTHMERVD
jgi:hypothetical protein